MHQSENFDPFKSLEAPKLPLRAKSTFEPAQEAKSTDQNERNTISVDHPTNRILLGNLSFDHVVLKDGYMEPAGTQVP